MQENNLTMQRSEAGKEGLLEAGRPGSKSSSCPLKGGFFTQETLGAGIGFLQTLRVILMGTKAEEQSSRCSMRS